MRLCFKSVVLQPLVAGGGFFFLLFGIVYTLGRIHQEGKPRNKERGASMHSMLGHNPMSHNEDIVYPTPPRPPFFRLSGSNGNKQNQGLSSCFFTLTKAALHPF